MARFQPSGEFAIVAGRARAPRRRKAERFMGLGILTLLLALAGAGWLLLRAARGGAGAGGRTMTLFKGVAFLVLAAALFAAKLWPLAFMTLVAAGAITAIETWREREIRRSETGTDVAAPRPEMRADEAASILGVSLDAAPDDIRAAHKKLIGQLHPDKGGTDYLAAKINDARDVLLSRGSPAENG